MSKNSSIIRRASGVSGIQDVHSKVQKSVAAMKDTVMELSSNIIIHEIIDENDAEVMNRIVEGAKKVAVLEELNTLMKKNIDSELLKVQKERNEFEAAAAESRRLQPQGYGDDAAAAVAVDQGKKRGPGHEPFSAKKAAKRIEELTEKGIRNFAPNNVEFVKAVKASVGGANEDDDVVVQRTKFSEKDTKCCYSTMTFKDAQRNNSKKKCDHRIDKMSLLAMAKNAKADKDKSKTFGCAQAGCTGLWSLKTMEPDAAYMKKVAFFLRKQEVFGDTGKAVDAEVLEDAEEEDYTMI